MLKKIVFLIACGFSLSACGANSDLTTSQVETSTDGGSGDAVAADPPPVTLGSYPWLLITEVQTLENGNTIVRGLVLDENDPPGIPVFKGHLIRRDDAGFHAAVPIHVRNRITGEVWFEIPTTWVESKLIAVMSGPGYTNTDFPVCDFPTQ